jgi:hypothetical protein
MILTICIASIPWGIVVAYLWHKSSRRYRDERLITGLITRLAKAEGDRRILKSALAKQYSENERLTSEKLQKWNIPDHI